MKSCDIIKNLKDKYPNCQQENTSLFEEISHAMLILEDISKKVGIPQCELLEFFYRTKIKIDTIDRQEEIYNVRKNKDTM